MIEPYTYIDNTKLFDIRNVSHICCIVMTLLYCPVNTLHRILMITMTFYVHILFYIIILIQWSNPSRNREPHVMYTQYNRFFSLASHIYIELLDALLRLCPGAEGEHMRDYTVQLCSSDVHSLLLCWVDLQ